MPYETGKQRFFGLLGETIASVPASVQAYRESEDRRRRQSFADLIDLERLSLAQQEGQRQRDVFNRESETYKESKKARDILGGILGSGSLGGQSPGYYQSLIPQAGYTGEELATLRQPLRDIGVSRETSEEALDRERAELARDISKAELGYLTTYGQKTKPKPKPLTPFQLFKIGKEDIDKQRKEVEVRVKALRSDFNALTMQKGKSAKSMLETREPNAIQKLFGSNNPLSAKADSIRTELLLAEGELRNLREAAESPGFYLQHGQSLFGEENANPYDVVPAQESFLSEEEKRRKRYPSWETLTPEEKQALIDADE